MVSKGCVTLGTILLIIGCFSWPLVNLASKKYKYHCWEEQNTAAWQSVLATQHYATVFYSYNQQDFCWLLPKFINGHKINQRLGGMYSTHCGATLRIA